MVFETPDESGKGEDISMQSDKEVQDADLMLTLALGYGPITGISSLVGL